MRRLGGIAVVGWLLCSPATSWAQALEVTPFIGYRFGGDFFERITGQAVDLDGARVVGAAVDVKFPEEGLFLEALFSHEQARLRSPGGLFTPPAGWEITVDHWLAGGLQEFWNNPRARPFLTGLLGLTRYAAEGNNEIRFTVSAGGGVKLMPKSRVGVRLDGRVFTTFADIDGRVIACTVGVCLVAFDAEIVWQAEFSAGLVVAFP